MKNDKEEKIVYVLGAGFSRDVGAPILKEFLNYGNGNISKMESDNTLLKGKLYLLYLIYLKFLEENEIKNNEINVEDFAQYLQNKRGFYRISKGEAMELFPKIPDDNIPEEIIEEQRISKSYIKMLLDFYYFRFIHSEIEKKWSDKNLFNYRKFFKHLAGSELNTIITYNYDCIPEIFLNEYVEGFNYCLEDMNINIVKIEPPIKNINIRNKIIKLHGSINWYYCRTCKNLKIDKIGTLKDYDYNEITNYTDHKKNEKCEYYDEEINNNVPGSFEMFMIPPGFKVEPISDELEEKARDELKDANKIIFIGYRFLENDIDARRLFNHRKTEYKPDVKVEIYNSKKGIKNLETFKNLLPENSIVIDEGKYGYLKDYINQ